MMYSYPIYFISPTTKEFYCAATTSFQPHQPQGRTAGRRRWTCAVYAGRGQNLSQTSQLEIRSESVVIRIRPVKNWPNPQINQITSCFLERTLPSVVTKLVYHGMEISDAIAIRISFPMFFWADWTAKTPHEWPMQGDVQQPLFTVYQCRVHDVLITFYLFIYVVS